MLVEARQWVVRWEGMTCRRYPLRPAVAAFAIAMEARLAANDHKGGWGACGRDYLMEKLAEEVGELMEAVARGENGALAREAVDVGNIGMMLADNFGGLMAGQR